MVLLTGLMSKYAGRLGGLVCVSGYLPLADKISDPRLEAGVLGELGILPILLTRGVQDVVVPKRYFRICVQGLKQLGIKKESLEKHEYEDLGHDISPLTLRDMCGWFKSIVPYLQKNSVACR